MAGVDFTANHAPVVNDVSFRIILAMILMFNWSTFVIDVDVAFLNGDMEELIFMALPKGFNIINGNDRNDEDEECVVLDKCIYGTVQAARQWAKKFRESLKKLKFEVSLIDPCVMTRRNDDGIVILCIYVDDVLMVGDQSAIDKAIEDIEKVFSIRKEGKLNDYIGCIIEFENESEATMHQPHILKKLKNKFSDIVMNIRTGKTPSPPGSVLMRPKENEAVIDEDKQNIYRSGVGTLLYLTKHTRPDIANSVREHSKMMDGATIDHYNSLLKLIKYVIDSERLKLRLKVERTNGNVFMIEGYSDSDYASNKDDRKSISGMVIYLCGVPIMWKSKSQKAVTLSSTEAEYYSLSELCSELIFVKNMLEFMGMNVGYPIVARVDNIGAMFLSNNYALSQRTKHISVRQHFVRQYVEDGIVKVVFVRSKQNDSDIFTKNLNKELFDKHRGKIMMGETYKPDEQYKDVD